MGWTSSADTAQQLYDVMFFDTKEDAVYFAERNGYTYDIEVDLNRDHKLIHKKAYADNFKWKGKPKSRSDHPPQQAIEEMQARAQTNIKQEKQQQNQEAAMDKAKAADKNQSKSV